MSYAVTVIIEAYNEEHNALAEHTETIDALLAQDFPLDQVELLIIGTDEQIGDASTPPEWSSFGTVRLEVVPPTSSHYWQQKNFGARLAIGKIIVWLDSDVTPERSWLGAIVSAIEGGADVSVGPSLYRSRYFGSRSPLMIAAGFVSWSFVLSRHSEPGNPQAASLLAHNLGIRRDVALKVPFRTSPGSFLSSLLYFDLIRAGATVSYQLEQKVAHAMTFKWWVARRHFRAGWETCNRRESDPIYPRHRSIERMRWIEPIIYGGGKILRDMPHWFRYRHVIGLNFLYAWGMLPLVLLASVAARSAEVVGMYAFRIAPRITAHQARF